MPPTQPNLAHHGLTFEVDMPISRDTFPANNLRRERRRAGLTQAQLSARSGIGRCTISTMENGYLSHADTRGAVAKALGQESENLFPGTG